MIQLHTFTVNDFQENTYLVWDSTGSCCIVDPGCQYDHERQKINQFITENKLDPMMVLNTHCHIDHILSNTYFTDHYQIPLYLHEQELFTYTDSAKWSAMLSVPVCELPANHRFISEKDSIRFGQSLLDIAFTPGHSIASLTFYNLTEKFALAGDVLFHESIGRTDLPGGNHGLLLRSIREQLMVWDDDIRIYSGHGPSTTIGHERRHNPFLT